ncbi:C-terminal binding protein [Enterococcus faecalis]|uniref:C-terminal binding protein n=1 Tax=Enterococcus TaxID=1350 RepID=UPI00094E59DA|nr:C-terminal binding protein [Enterococcus faecalis]EGO5250795.1 C-terminal binding protein [Enterococcus faecalis]EGO6146525.1 C-terminal binding protein [Enterococcus faecalis]EGO8181729.1 C-terminal binding protein [Enterococcus faecalis]EGO9362344.1 C-terminal binding protein [Enterococcus faecalis]EGO9385542.1 C-terminal binding protein [Enterococcus faecalis]
MKVVRLFEDNMFEHELKVIKELNLDLEMKVHPSQTSAEIIENAKDADIIITVYEPLTKEVLSQLPNLKLVVYRSVGFNSVDLAYANERRLPVSHITQYCVDEVANYVIAAILSHNRRILDFNESVKVDHKWDYELFPDMRRLSSLTVGLIGFGNIPRLVAQRLQVFGCKLIAYDPFVDAEIFAKSNVKQASLEEIFEQSDYISSHLPLNNSTKGILNKNLFNLCQKQPVFVNSSRGGVVNEVDLVAALQLGKLSYAILDVVNSEDPDLSKLPFMQMNNVVLTPHIAFYSQEAFIQGVQDNFKNIQAFLNGDLAKAEIVNLKQIQSQILKRD